jgi:hypothetical protein
VRNEPQHHGAHACNPVGVRRLTPTYGLTRIGTEKWYRDVPFTDLRMEEWYRDVPFTDLRMEEWYRDVPFTDLRME